MDNREIFIKNINKLILRSGKQRVDIASELDIPLTTFVSWTNGVKFPRPESLKKLADYFNVSTAELLLSDDEIIELERENYEIPVFRSVSCGNPTAETDEIVGYETLPDSWKKKGDFFGVRAKGDSMYPKIEDGDILIVRKQPQISSGDIAIVKVNGEEATCKKIITRFDGITLQPLNGKYEATFYTEKQILNEPITILGRVVEVRKKL